MYVHPGQQLEVALSGIDGSTEIESLLSVWRLLQSVHSVDLSISDSDAGPAQIQGTGEVATEAVGGSELVIRERGRWSGPKGDGSHFTDSLRWTLDTEAGLLRLEHLRRGPDEPVMLMELVPDGRGLLTPLGPHLCGEDRYDGAMRVLDDGVEVSWKVTGPKKNMEIRRRYT